MQTRYVGIPGSNGTVNRRPSFLRVLALILVAGLSTIVSAPFSNAATSGVLYTFQGGTDGANPAGSLVEVGGAFYGTTAHGGDKGCGTVFSLTPGGVEKVIYSFQCGKDGFYPHAGLIKVGNKLYGTTTNEEQNVPNCHAGTKPATCGTIFSITIAGVHKVVHVFKGGTDGQAPYGNLVDVNGTLYGTTLYGGSGGAVGNGAIFSLTPPRLEKIVYAFPDFAGLRDGLIDVGGTLYGTASQGYVYSVTPSGVASTVYEFQGGTDGQSPYGALVDVAGLLYGTTTHGGLFAKQAGTVFKLSPTEGTELPIYTFQAGTDGKYSSARMIYVGGTLYGTTSEGGGTGCGGLGCGTVFSTTRRGTETVLATFGTGANGGNPQANLINYNGTLYGTAYDYGHNSAGCPNGCGTVFWVKP